MSRTTISVRDDVFDQLEADKPSDQSWSDFLEELHENAAKTDTRQDEHAMNALTEEHIDDIAVATADRIENRLTRR